MREEFAAFLCSAVSSISNQQVWEFSSYEEILHTEQQQMQRHLNGKLENS